MAEEVWPEPPVPIGNTYELKHNGQTVEMLEEAIDLSAAIDQKGGGKSFDFAFKAVLIDASATYILDEGQQGSRTDMYNKATAGLKATDRNPLAGGANIQFHKPDLPQEVVHMAKVQQKLEEIGAQVTLELVVGKSQKKLPEAVRKRKGLCKPPIGLEMLGRVTMLAVHHHDLKTVDDAYDFMEDLFCIRRPLFNQLILGYEAPEDAKRRKAAALQGQLVVRSSGEATGTIITDKDAAAVLQKGSTLATGGHNYQQGALGGSASSKSRRSDASMVSTTPVVKEEKLSLSVEDEKQDVKPSFSPSSSNDDVSKYAQLLEPKPSDNKENEAPTTPSPSSSSSKASASDSSDAESQSEITVVVASSKSKRPAVPSRVTFTDSDDSQDETPIKRNHFIKPSDLASDSDDDDESEEDSPQKPVFGASDVLLSTSEGTSGEEDDEEEDSEEDYCYSELEETPRRTTKQKIRLSVAVRRASMGQEEDCLGYPTVVSPMPKKKKKGRPSHSPFPDSPRPTALPTAAESDTLSDEDQGGVFLGVEDDGEVSPDHSPSLQQDTVASEEEQEDPLNFSVDASIVEDPSVAEDQDAKTVRGDSPISKIAARLQDIALADEATKEDCTLPAVENTGSVSSLPPLRIDMLGEVSFARILSFLTVFEGFAVGGAFNRRSFSKSIPQQTNNIFTATCPKQLRATLIVASRTFRARSKAPLPKDLPIMDAVLSDRLIDSIIAFRVRKYGTTPEGKRRVLDALEAGQSLVTTSVPPIHSSNEVGLDTTMHGRTLNYDADQSDTDDEEGNDEEVATKSGEVKICAPPIKVYTTTTTTKSIESTSGGNSGTTILAEAPTKASKASSSGGNGCLIQKATNDASSNEVGLDTTLHGRTLNYDADSDTDDEDGNDDEATKSCDDVKICAPKKQESLVGVGPGTEECRHEASEQVPSRQARTYDQSNMADEPYVTWQAY